MANEAPTRITATPEITSRERDNPKGFGKPRKLKPLLTNEQFKDLLNGVLSNEQIQALRLPEVHFVIKLQIPYDEDKEVISILEKRKIRTVSVIDSSTLLVCAKTTDLNALFAQKQKTSLQILGRIRYLGVIKPQEKLGNSILQLLTRANDETVIPIRILLPRDINEHDISVFMRNISRIAKGAEYSSFGNSFKAQCTKKQINLLAELTFVEKITEAPRAQGQSTAVIETDHVDFQIMPPTGTLPSACVLDTGIGDYLRPHCDSGFTFVGSSISDEDDESHGTSVASVALFGADLTEDTSTHLKPTAKVIPIKIAKNKNPGPDETSDLIEQIQKSVEKFRHKSRIFTTSFCITDIEPALRRRIAQDIDKMLFKENIILINAAGNIQDTEQHTHLRSWGAIPILAPSDSHLTLAVGSGKLDRDKFSKAKISRCGRSPLFLNDTNDKRLYYKPDVFANGGDIASGTKKSTLTSYLPTKIRAMDKNGKAIQVAGTSYAAPLVANMLCRIEKIFGQTVRTAERLKAMLISKCVIFEVKEKSYTLVVPSRIDPCRADDAIYIDFETENVPTIEAPKGKSKKKINCMAIHVPVDSRIDSIDIFICHSTSASDFDPARHISKIIVEARKPCPNPNKIRRAGRKCGNINDFAALTYGRYTCANSPGLWTFALHLEAKWIPSDMLAKLQSRMGVSIRLNIKRKYLSQLPEIYQAVRAHFAETAQSAIKEADVSVTERGATMAT